MGGADRSRWGWSGWRARLTVRAMMLLVLLFAVGLGRVVHRAHAQRDAVAAVRRAGGWVGYDWEMTHFPAGSPGTRYGSGLTTDPKARPRWPNWLIDLLGPDYFCDVAAVRLGASATDVDLATIGGLARLEELDADACPGLTDAGVAQLRGLTSLTSLKLRSDGLTGASLANLGGLTRLQFLSLGASKFDDRDLAHLRGLVRLKTLLLNGPGIADAGMAHLAPLVNLRWLGIGPGSGVTSVGLAELRGMEGLVRLTLMECQVGDLAPIRHLRGLEELVFRKAPIDDAGLTGVAELAALRTLAIPNARITDAGLIHLGRMDRLEVLNINGTAVTDAGLDHLASVATLGRLMVKSTRVTDAGVASLREKLPRIRAVR